MIEAWDFARGDRFARRQMPEGAGAQNNALPARIDELLKEMSTLLARITELEGCAGKPKTPINSSLPPSSGQKANVTDKSGRKKKWRKGRSGLRASSVQTDVTRNIHVGAR